MTSQEPIPSPTAEFEATPLEPRNFESTEWKKATEGIDYRNSTKDQKNINEDVGDDLGGSNAALERKARELGGAAGTFWNTLVKIIFGIFIIALIGFVLYSIMRGENIFKKKKKIQNEGNYSLAIRLHYLAIIKELSRKKIIRYKKNKTNHVYVAKVNSTSFGEEFREATHAFERIWFGQNTFTQIDYQQVKPNFVKWIGSVKNLNSEQPSLNLNTP